MGQNGIYKILKFSKLEFYRLVMTEMLLKQLPTHEQLSRAWKLTISKIKVDSKKDRKYLGGKVL